MTLTESEKVLLVGVIDNYLEGLSDAKDNMIDDTAAHTTADQLLESMAIVDEERAVLTNIRTKVMNDV